jgi:hypothetical protein
MMRKSYAKNPPHRRRNPLRKVAGTQSTAPEGRHAPPEGRNITERPTRSRSYTGSARKLGFLYNFCLQSSFTGAEKLKYCKKLYRKDREKRFSV